MLDKIVDKIIEYTLIALEIVGIILTISFLSYAILSL